MILFSDRGPSRGRYSGSRPPKIRQSGKGTGGTPPPSDSGSGFRLPCSTVIAVPAVCVLAVSLIATGVVR